jgi:hypothetical protein
MRALALLLMVGCADLGGPTDAVPSAGAVTWNRDVAAILERRCVGCHSESGLGGFPLDDYATAAALAPQLVDAVESGRMPPFGAPATDACPSPFPWVDDPRLSVEEMLLLRVWAETGAPRGSGALRHAAPAAAPPRVDDVLRPQGVEVVEPGPDQHRCFVLQPRLPILYGLEAISIEPGDADVVHHALLFSDPGGVVSAQAVGGSFDCFGLKPEGGRLLASYAPGMGATIAPAGTALAMRDSDPLILQIHYHPRPDELRYDRTRVNLTYRWEEAEYAALQLLIGNLDTPEAGSGNGLLADADGVSEFLIPAGATDHVEQMMVTLPVAVPFYSLGAHMHLAGRSMQLLLSSADGQRSDCLLDVPDWDFSAQRAYEIDKPLGLLPTSTVGDRLVLRCAYDNSLGNGALAEELAAQGLDAPVDMVLGEASLDEMCLAVVGLVVPWSQVETAEAF